jgi:uncharacterized protein YcbK (DUF882 family)
MSYFTWKKGEKIQLSKNFNSLEFECKCKNADCVNQKISKELIEDLQKVRDDYGKSMTVTSGYRCFKHNRAIGSTDTSQHPQGNAADITASDLNALYAACEKHFKAIGDARHNKKFIHVDSRKEKVRRWNY